MTLNTKEKIADAFLTQISTTSLSRITINDIIERAEISRSTFYRLFHSISDLINFTDDYVDASIFNNFTELSIKYTSSQKWVEILATELAKNRDKLKIMYSSDLRAQWIDYLSKKYHSWLKQNIFATYHSKKVPEDMAIQLFTQSISSVVDYWITSPIPVSTETFQKQLLKLLQTSTLELTNL
ncbi:TetR/AcrR family transcriptional regulator [Fructilactobacillus sp. Tb1]|uniref:TetR/AcrR family transcriptional regulator n=1 Tax=Fructilactobacillus sp. Tb1 TaxID=3422304 RepID=UPI003D2E05EB